LYALKYSWSRQYIVTTTFTLFFFFETHIIAGESQQIALFGVTLGEDSRGQFGVTFWRTFSRANCPSENLQRFWAIWYDSLSPSVENIWETRLQNISFFVVCIYSVYCNLVIRLQYMNNVWTNNDTLYYLIYFDLITWILVNYKKKMVICDRTSIEMYLYLFYLF